MANTLTSAAALPEGRGLSEAERVVDTFIAPSKTFTDIRRNSSWWLPFVLMIVASLASAFVVQRQVGFDRVAENQVHSSPKQEEKLNALPPEQKARQLAISATVTKYITYAFPLLLLAGFALYSLLLWAAFNFGLGAQTTFGQVFAVTFYASLPYLLTTLLTIAVLLFGGNAEAYDFKNPVGTNLAYFMPETGAFLKSILSGLDLIKLWSLVLQVLGMAIIARKTITQSAMIVVGWFVIVLIGGAAITAATS